MFYLLAREELQTKNIAIDPQNEVWIDPEPINDEGSLASIRTPKTTSVGDSIEVSFMRGEKLQAVYKRRLNGWSKVASMKPRYHGKFVKKGEINFEIPSLEELQRRNAEIDK